MLTNNKTKFSFHLVLTALIFLLNFLNACSDSSKKRSSSKNNPEVSTSTHQNAKKSVSSQYYYSQLELKDLDLSIEVIYAIDEANSLYQEWVRWDQNGNISVSYFKFAFKPENYLALKSNESKYFENFKSENRSIQLDQEQILSLENRFKNQIPDSEFTALKNSISDVIQDSKYSQKMDKSCNSDWDDRNKNIISFYQVQFQHCHFSKYQDLAKQDLKSYLMQNRYLVYKNLFGLEIVFPQVSSFLEISNDGRSMLGLGTAYAPDSYFLRAQSFRMSESGCMGRYIDKEVSDLNVNKNLFIGAVSDPAFIESYVFVNTCSRIYKNSNRFIVDEINSLYPDTSDMFKSRLERMVSQTFNISSIDEKISNDLDVEIEKYNFLLPNFNNSTPIEVYENWKKTALKSYDFRFNGFYLNSDNAKKRFSLFYDYVLSPEERARFFVDQPDIFSNADQAALANLESYILMVDF